jgi:hypothetical protein
MSLNKRLINTGGVFAPEFAASTPASFSIANDNNFATKTVKFTLDYYDAASDSYINYYTEQWVSAAKNITFTPASGSELFATNTKTRRTITITGAMSSTSYLTPNQITRAGSYVFSNVSISALDSSDNLYQSTSSTSISATSLNNGGNNYNLLGTQVIFDYTL